MPRIDDQTTQTKRPFKKKPYRPWNLLDDDLPSTTIEKSTPETTPHDEVTNKEAISNQTEIVTESSRNQIVNQTPIKVIRMESVGNLISNQISNQSVNTEILKSIKISDERNAIQEVQRVFGLQRKILFYIVEDCILRGELSTSPITSESLKNLTNTDTDTVKTATQRLINKKLMQRGYGKKGKGGFAIFHITEQIRTAVIAAQKQELPNQNLVTNWVSKKEPMSTYSSSNINTTTTNETHNSKLTALPKDNTWDNINLEPLNKIGFTRSHLRQIIMDDKLPIDMVQESIDAFAFDLEKNNKEKSLKSNPLNYFMGILRSGKPYAPPVNYESPRDIALRVYLERKKELEQKRQAMEDDLFQIAFKEWELRLNVEEKEFILPVNVRNSRLASDKIASLRLHFKEQIWPNVRTEYLISAGVQL
jgi:hypothetical protein